jgi:hypothetical protein
MPADKEFRVSRAGIEKGMAPSSLARRGSGGDTQIAAYRDNKNLSQMPAADRAQCPVPLNVGQSRIRSGFDRRRAHSKTPMGRRTCGTASRCKKARAPAWTAE